MTKWLLFIVLGIFLIAGCGGGDTATVLNLTGSWQGNYNATNQNTQEVKTGWINLNIVQTQTALNGTGSIAEGSATATGSVSGSNVTLNLDTPIGMWTATGTATEWTMDLTFSIIDGNDIWDGSATFNKIST